MALINLKSIGCFGSPDIDREFWNALLSTNSKRNEACDALYEFYSIVEGIW